MTFSITENYTNANEMLLNSISQYLIFFSYNIHYYYTQTIDFLTLNIHKWQLG